MTSNNNMEKHKIVIFTGITDSQTHPSELILPYGMVMYGPF